MRLKIDPDESIKMLLGIPHKIFRDALPARWTVADDWMVQDCSLLWFFCWCKNGLNSNAARMEAIRVWNTIMPVSFGEFEPTINHEEARKYRYNKSAHISPTN